MNNNKDKLNLDKICAEFGMNLLNIPKSLYQKASELINNSSNKDDFLNRKNYNFSDSEKSIKDFQEYKLIDPLQDMKDKINKSKPDKQEEIYSNLKNKPLKFTSKDYETEITKALGILVEDGPFAYMVWLRSQNNEPCKVMLIQTTRLLLELNIIQNTNNELKKDLSGNIEKLFLDNIFNNLTTLFLVKTVLEKMLIYARYKAKAMQKGGK